jgi:hypothetical protein
MKKHLLFLCTLVCTIPSLIHAQSWSLTGNAGTSPITNYLGTRDANALQLRVNNQKSGYIDYALTNGANTAFGYQTLFSISGSHGGNTALGYQGLFKNTTGAFNTATGQLSMNSNTTGSSNTATGVRSLFNNTKGSFNSAFGNRAASSNTTGISNVAIGASALFSCTKCFNTIAIGDSALFSFNPTYSLGYNTAVGSKSLYTNTSGSSNTAIGYQALYSNTITSSNTAVGSFALFSHNGNEGYEDANTAVGDQALYSDQTGYENVAVGQYALYSNTSGGRNTSIGASTLQNNTTGLYNVAIGWGAMYGNISGTYNVGIGYSTLYSSNAGHDNIAIGFSALSDNTTGVFNTAYGSDALFDNVSGSYNTGVGYDTRVNYFGSDNVSNATVLGNGATATAANQVRLGNSSVTSIGGFANWSNISDGRYKKNIKTDVIGLAFINMLQPITYTLDIEGINKAIHPDVTLKQGDKNVELKMSDDEKKAMIAKSQIRYNGFIAQDVEKVAKQLNYDFSGVDAPKNDKDLYGLRYSDFVVPLVKAVQELSKMNDEKDTKINELEARIGKLEALMNVQQSSLSSNPQTVTLTSVTLGQNVPNPYNNTTTINYSLPVTYSSAKIIITDKGGSTLKEINLPAGRQDVAGSKSGTIKVDASTLSAGAYQYSLYVNEKLVASKQMIVAK